MRAFVVEALNEFAIRDDVETYPLGPLEVKVQIKAAGVCRSDLSVINGKYATGLPCVNGHEGAGIITEVGSEVRNRHVGQRVLMGQSQCGECYYCSHQAPWFCATKDPGGTRAKFRLADGTPVMSHVGKGTWAEEIVIPANMAVPIPDGVPYDVAAVITCAVITGTGGVINVAQPEVGSSAIFFGGGGIGACAVMGAQLSGCGQIVVVEPSVAKHDVLRKFGATHVITPSEVPQIIGDLTANRGFDYSFENVGRPETLRAAWDAARLNGTVVVTGLGGAMGKVEFNMNELTVHGKRILGNVGGGSVASRDYQRYCELYLLGKLDLDALITSRGVLEDLPDYITALDNDPTVIRQIIEFQ